MVACLRCDGSTSGCILAHVLCHGCLCFGMVTEVRCLPAGHMCQPRQGPVGHAKQSAAASQRTLCMRLHSSVHSESNL